MTVQFVEISGQKMAMLPMADYERLMQIAEDRADIAAAIESEKRRHAGEEYVPIELIDRIIAGESPLRVWRKYRGMTLAQLSAATGTRYSTLSEIENGKAQGKPALWRALATALDVAIDDIIPQS